MTYVKFKKKRENLCSLSRSTKQVNYLLMEYYKKINEDAAKGKTVAWVGLDFPGYLLWAMDIIPVCAQVQAAFQGKRKSVKKIMMELESRQEIPHSICGEVKGVIGAVLSDHEVSFEVPKPDVLITANSSCNSMGKGFRYLSEYLGVELLFADFPFIYGEIKDEMMEFSCAQMKDVLLRLEEISGQEIVIEKIRSLSEDLVIILKLWDEICLLNANVPAPVESLDLFLFSSSRMILQPDEKLIELMIKLYNEIYGQIERNKEKEYKEKYRILWHYLPVNAQKNFFKNLFEEYSATVVAGTFFSLFDSSVFGWDYQFTYPLTQIQITQARQSIRRAALVKETLDDLIMDTVIAGMMIDVNRNIAFKNEKIKKLIDIYKIDGVIIQCDRSCRPQSLPQYEIRRYITEELGIPVLFFDADSMDDRYFSPSQVTTRFEAFIEQIESRKR
jgi:benzoyl-CoA reductase/2-hydroxyglutaryl-CoA dehydratase subunit BcrC/BadD/HgdB